jgi:hypothetical protein
VTTPSHDLLDWLPDGRVQYIRRPDMRWGVGVFPPGSTELLIVVAEGMDKNAAAWLSQALVAARPDRFAGADVLTENEIASIPRGIL